MNEQIRKLAEQAGLVGANGHFEYDFFDPEKFAELIVRECLSIVEPDVGMSCGDEWYTTLEATAQEIREHFGVD